MIEGTIFDISRYCLDDGPGIRTTVFLKGCPLRCMWCHNPESLSSEIEIAYDEKKCVNCGECVRVCTDGAHQMIDGKHVFDRSKSKSCGKCVEVCEYGALYIIGRKMSVDDVMKVVERDRSFYEKSGGGMTISGGECMFQPEFTKALFMEAKRRGISTCVETSGYVSEKKLREVAPYIDTFLFDCKQINAMIHRRVTCVPNQLILKNLRMLNEMGKRIVLRLPIIPGINDNEEHFKGVGELADSLENILYLEVLPYHPLGLSKAEVLQKEMPYQLLELPESATVDFWVESLRTFTKKKVIRATS